MAVTIVRYEPTPNPHALKCVLSGSVSDESLPFRTAAAAAAHPLAAALFAVEGVAGLLLHKDWMTVSKSPAAKWPAIKRGVEQALAAHG
ncbi:MAG: NifU N-terminal domain-containing protein [Phycisphaerales bacterium]|nr:NifU N-terminal domain-containing protein [Phycisphaerales bacterium]